MQQCGVTREMLLNLIHEMNYKVTYQLGEEVIIEPN